MLDQGLRAARWSSQCFTCPWTEAHGLAFHCWIYPGSTPDLHWIRVSCRQAAGPPLPSYGIDFLSRWYSSLLLLIVRRSRTSSRSICSKPQAETAGRGSVGCSLERLRGAVPLDGHDSLYGLWTGLNDRSKAQVHAAPMAGLYYPKQCIFQSMIYVHSTSPGICRYHPRQLKMTLFLP